MQAGNNTVSKNIWAQSFEGADEDLAATMDLHARVERARCYHNRFQNVERVFKDVRIAPQYWR
jgi:hypothetical protein